MALLRPREHHIPLHKNMHREEALPDFGDDARNLPPVQCIEMANRADWRRRIDVGKPGHISILVGIRPALKIYTSRCQVVWTNPGSGCGRIIEAGP